MNLFTYSWRGNDPATCSTGKNSTNLLRFAGKLPALLFGAAMMLFSVNSQAQCDITVNWGTVSGSDFIDNFFWDILDGDNNVAFSGGNILGQGASSSATLSGAANGPYTFQWEVAVNSFCDNFVAVTVLVNGSPDLSIANTGGDGCGGYGGGPTALGGCAALPPPAGDTCAEATPIAAGSQTTGTITGFGIIDACSLGGGTGARWFSWTAPSDGDVDIYACGAVDSRLSVFTGTCASLTCIADNDDANQAYPCQTGNFAAGTSFSAIDGVTYLIQWDDRWSTAGFAWNLDFAPAADPGENCFNAIAATTGTQTAPAINPAASGASNNCLAGATGAVWYEWTAPSNGDVDVYACGATDTRLSIYDGSCAALNCVANNDDANQSYPCQTGNFAAGASFAAVGGVTYYIEWDDRWSSVGFDWNLDFVTGPTGDSCADPVAAVEGANTVGAIAINGGAVNNCFGGATNAYWFEWTAPGNGDVDVYACGALDTRVSIYDGSCAALNCVASNDDANQSYPCQTGNLAAGTSFSVSNGVTYYIEWDDRWSTAGFTWNLDFVLATDPGESCATPLAAVTGTQTAPAINPAASGASNNCLVGATGAVWYEWTAPANGDVDVYSCGTLDTRVSIYDGSCAALNCVASNDDAGQSYPCQTGTLAAGTSFAVVGGVTYLIEWDDRWSTSGFTWNLDFTLGATGDDCEAAVTAVEGTNNVSSISVNGSAPNTCISGGADAYWFEWTAPGDGSVDVYSCGAIDTHVVIYDGSCAALNCVADNDDANQAYPCQTGDFAAGVSFSVTSGVTYYIEWNNDWSSAGFDWNLDFDADPVPCTSGTPFGTSSAPVLAGIGATNAGVWAGEFTTFTLLDAAQTYEITSSIGTDYLNITDASNNSIVDGTAPLTISGVSGTIRVHVFLNDACATQNTGRGITIQCTTCPPPPPIAWCDIATTIGCEATESGTTVGAPTDAVPVTCVTTNGTGGKVAYIFTGSGDDVVFNTVGSTYDTKLWVFEYNASCQAGDLVCVTGNDDAAGIGALSQVQFNAADGVDYLIIVGGFSANQGNYVLNSFCALGCTNPIASNYDPTATFDDGSCIASNDTSANALNVGTSPLGTCTAFSQDIDLASTNQGGTITGFGNDLWYEFEAVTSGVRIETATTSFDVVLELFDASLNPILGVDDVFVNGGEVLNFGGLTAGDNYLVRVAAWGSAGGPRPFNLCIQWLPDTECNFPSGSYSLCSPFKARWVPGGTNYIFNFTPTGGGATISYATGAAFTVVPLQNVPGLLWETEYDLSIDVELSLTTSTGGSETIAVQGTSECTIEVPAPPTAALRAQDNLVNAGPLFLGAYIAATPWICTTQEWEWEFVNTNGIQLPITHLSGGPSRFVRLVDVPGLQPGDVYDVRVRPVFPTGAPSNYGAVDQIAIVGSLGLGTDIESPVVNDEIVDRVEVETAAGIAIYPNPNRGDFMNVNISGINAGVDRVLVDIYDLAGKRVISEQLAVGGNALNVVMPLNGLADGMYIVNVIMDGEVHTERMIVQK